MGSDQLHGPRWTRRAVLQAGAGLAAYAVARPAYAETAVAASNICVDWPILDPVADRTLRDQVKKSPVAAALFHDNNSLRFEDHLPAAAASALLQAPSDGKSASPFGPSRAAFLNSWPNTLLKVFFMSGTSAKLRRVVMDQIAAWSECCAVTFQETTNLLDSQIRLDFRRTLGHFSAVGVDANGTPRDQTMNLDMNDLSVDDPYNRGVILHEFGHAIGMVHEHSSPASTINFKDADDPDMRAFFEPRGIRGRDAINFNVINRYKATQMKKFSDFDRDSIMLYAFPTSILRSGEGTKQNTVLSATDKKFANMLYPKNGPVVDNSNRADSQTFTIALGGDAVEAKLAANSTVEFKLNIPSAQGGSDIVIYTTGSTQVVMKLADSVGKDLTPSDTPNHGTPDFMNEVIKVRAIPAGDYKVTIVHPSARGGGSFKLQARTGNFDRLLASPNRRQ
jgi:serralysin